MLFPKFVVEGDKLIVGAAEFHKDLVSDQSAVKGGGSWVFNKELKLLFLSGRSVDFGEATEEDIANAFEANGIIFKGVTLEVDILRFGNKVVDLTVSV